MRRRSGRSRRRAAAAAFAERELEEAERPVVEHAEDARLPCRAASASSARGARLVDAAEVGIGERDDERPARRAHPPSCSSCRSRLARVLRARARSSGAALELRQMDQQRAAVELVAQLGRGLEACLEQLAGLVEPVGVHEPQAVDLARAVVVRRPQPARARARQRARAGPARSCRCRSGSGTACPGSRSSIAASPAASASWHARRACSSALRDVAARASTSRPPAGAPRRRAAIVWPGLGDRLLA